MLLSIPLPILLRANIRPARSAQIVDRERRC
jgi:hypothetical protein